MTVFFSTILGFASFWKSVYGHYAHLKTTLRMNFTSIIEKIEKSKVLDFGSIFSRSIELFKKVWLQGFVTVLLTSVAILPVYVILYLPMIMAGITDSEMLKSDDLPPAIAISMALLAPVVFFAIMVMVLAMNASFLRICKQKDLNEISKDEYFFYLKKKYLGKIFMLTLLLMGLVVLALATCGIGLIYLIVPISLFPAFLAFDEELSALEMVKSSLKLGNKNWLVIFGLIILMGLLAEMGIILCCVGILFTAMLAKIPTYFIYKDSIGFDDNK